MLMLAEEVHATISTETWITLIVAIVSLIGILTTHTMYLRGIMREMKQLRFAIISMANNPKDGKRALSHLAGSLTGDDGGEAD